jgi:hypothetical protein
MNSLTFETHRTTPDRHPTVTQNDTTTETNMDEIFSRISESKVTQSGNWIKDGKYLFTIKECKYERKTKGQTWISELVVLAASPIAGVYEKDGQACHANEPGAILVVPNAPQSVVSFVRVVDDARTPNAPGDVKAFVIALGGSNEQKFDSDEAAAKLKRMQEEASGVPENQRTRSPFALSCALICGVEQKMRGLLIECETTRSVIQKGDNKGKPIVKQRWKHVSFKHSVPEIQSQLRAEIAERRRCIDAGHPVPMPAVWPIPAEGAASTSTSTTQA